MSAFMKHARTVHSWGGLCFLLASHPARNGRRRIVVEWYEPEVQELEQLNKSAPPPAGAVLFYGSSSLRLWTTLGEDMAPWTVVNRAFGGSTLAACVHFFDRLVIPCAPGSIVLYAGDNDLGDGRAPDDVVRSLRAMLARIDAALGSIPVAYMSIKPSPARWSLRDRIQRVNEAARALMEHRPSGYYIDVYTSMLGPDGRPRAELFDADGLHLSARGYQVWTHILRPYVAVLSGVQREP
ncbi:lipolytic protein G-D-S-L family [Roseiflexus castenholzii DSM 13941]|uniref:Lipolytic protein G-D-S-L family n=1 Tax=Roseiflexus castenholzii (strain DSM 13941 / HLO8) TaxID=383372 RepID=A7NK18_ROSCS|nr:lipolytic protein G-D-S-L family [Roseiflexus castenholzii DSM 13941]